MSSKIQLTLALLKPDISLNEKAVTVNKINSLTIMLNNIILHSSLFFFCKQEIHRIISNNNFIFVKSKMIKLTKDEAKDFYKLHESISFRIDNFLNLKFYYKNYSQKGSFITDQFTQCQGRNPYLKILNPPKYINVEYKT